jgi:RNA polymerase sigma-70 factor (ECF subfamily)
VQWRSDLGGKLPPGRGRGLPRLGPDGRTTLDAGALRRPPGGMAEGAIEMARARMIAAAARVCSDPRMGPAREDLLPVSAGALPAGDWDPRRQLDDLFKQHSAFVARLVFRLLGREDEVDDIVQDVFVSLFGNLKKIRRPEAMRAWLATTAVRIARRRLRLRRIGFLLGRSQRVDPMSLEGHGSSAEDRLALWTVHQTLEKVSVNARLAWVLHHLEQEGIEEVASVLDCSKATVKRLVAEAQRKIKKALDR